MSATKNVFAPLACIVALFAATPAIAQEADDKIPIYRLDLLKRPGGATLKRREVRHRGERLGRHEPTKGCEHVSVADGPLSLVRAG